MIRIQQSRQPIGKETRLPVPESAALGIGRKRTTVARSDILQKFDGDPVFPCAEASDVKLCAEHVVKVLLFRAIVIAGSRNRETKFALIKVQAHFAIRNDDRGVIYPKKQLSGLRQIVPFLQTLSVRKLEY